MSGKYSENSPETAVEHLDPKIKSISGNVDYIVKNMTYGDYLGAVYSYEDNVRKKSFYDSKLPPIRIKFEKKKKHLEKLKRRSANNREEKQRIVSEALKEKEELRLKTQKRMDVRISMEVERAKQNAQADIERHNEAYNRQVKDFNDRINMIGNDIKKLNHEYKKIDSYRDRFEDYQLEESSEVADKEAYAWLKKAKDRFWLSPFQRELLKKDVKEVCGKRILSSEDLLRREKEFAESDIFKEIKKGEVTSDIIKKESFWVSLISTILVILILLGAVIKPANSFLTGVQAGASMVLMSTLLFAVINFLGRRFIFRSKISAEEIIMLVNAALLGLIVGYILWKNLIFDKKTVFAIGCTVISALNLGFWDYKLLTSRYLEKFMKMFPWLKNRARSEVFKKAADLENGKYNLHIYCYLNHNFVVQYLSVNYKNNVSGTLGNKGEENRNLYKKNKEILEQMKEEKKLLDEQYEENKAYELRRMKRLEQEIDRIEGKRSDTATLDLEGYVSQKVMERLTRLDSDYTALLVRIEECELELQEFKKKLDIVEKKYDSLAKQLDLIRSALRYWYKTPLPSATDYSLLDLLCFETKMQINIIHHDCQPFAFRYNASGFEKNPCRIVKRIIFRYIRGLIKINPCRLLQINIIDPISDPSILLGDEIFKRLTPKGIIRGVESPTDFEIRLISNEGEYAEFRKMFGSQCGEIYRLLKENHDEFGEGERYSLELANRIKDKLNKRKKENDIGDDNKEIQPYMYQVMMFVVPRADDVTDFEPPKEIVKSIEKDYYFNMGLMPIFFVDNNSVHEKWRDIVKKCPADCVVNQGKKAKK